jgi:GNAT superfamily N-acetyltransferase
VVEPQAVPQAQVEVRPLLAGDHAQWLSLARGYKAFYETETSDAEYLTAWQRLLAGDGVRGLGATLDGQLVGFTHYLFHTSTWTPSVCYLQDLFTDPAVRGRGVARALIDAVAAEARRQGAARLYWLTQDHNVVARRLYDRVAQHRGFIRYDHSLQ